MWLAHKVNKNRRDSLCSCMRAISKFNIQSNSVIPVQFVAKQVVETSRLGSPFVQLNALGWWPLIRMSSRSDTRCSPRDTLLSYRRIRGRVTTSDVIYGPNSSGETRTRCGHFSMRAREQYEEERGLLLAP